MAETQSQPDVGHAQDGSTPLTRANVPPDTGQMDRSESPVTQVSIKGDRTGDVEAKVKTPRSKSASATSPPSDAAVPPKAKSPKERTPVVESGWSPSCQSMTPVPVKTKAARGKASATRIKTESLFDSHSEGLWETGLVGPSTPSASSVPGRSKRVKAETLHNSKDRRSELHRILESETGGATESKPLGQLVAAAVRGRRAVLQLSGCVEDSRTVPVLDTLCIEPAPDCSLPPVLYCPALVVAGKDTRVVFRNLTLQASSTSRQTAVLELRQGASCEMIGCRLQKGGIALGEGTTIRLEGTILAECPGVGIAGECFKALVMRTCCVTRCLGDGLHLGRGSEVQIADCTFSDNELNGAVLDSSADGWQFDRCTFSRNGQYGVWANGGARVVWGQNSLISNTLGEKSGRGQLQGWLQGIWFRPGDPCAVWSEKHFAWLPGTVKDVTQDSMTVLAQPPDEALPAKKKNKKTAQEAELESEAPPPKRLCTKTPHVEATSASSSAASAPPCTLELTVRPDSVRQPRSGDVGVPDWSAKSQGTFVSRAYSLFLAKKHGRRCALTSK